MTPGFSQNTLNIHQKNGGVVSYGFAEKPVLTYVEKNLHVSTDKVSIDYPLAELEKLTFNELESSIGELRLEGQSVPVCIFRTDGTLVKHMETIAGPFTFDTQELPAGTYIIKQGNITTIIIRR